MSLLLNTTAWVLIANASEAKCYEIKRHGQDLALIKAYEHPENRLKDSDLVTDEPGHYISRDTAHGMLSEHHNPKENEAEHFAITLAHDLKHAKSKNLFEKLIVIAPPHFHGLLNKHFDKKTAEVIAHSIEKDYTKVAFKELVEYVNSLPK